MVGFVKVSNEVKEYINQLNNGAVILYMAILYKKRNKPLKITNDELSELCGGLGKNRITSCLNELEENGLIKRENKKITWVKHPTSKEELKNNFTLVDIKLINSEINPTAKLILYIMCSLKPNREGYIKISHNRLSKLLNMSERRVQEPIKILIKTGWIIDIKSRKGFNTPNEYKVRRVDSKAVYNELLQSYFEDEEDYDDDM